MRKILLFLYCLLFLALTGSARAESTYYTITSDDLFAKPGTVVEMANGNLFITGYRSILSDGLFDYGIYGIVSKTGTIIKSFSPIDAASGYGYNRKIDLTCSSPITMSLSGGEKVLVVCLTFRYSNNVLSESILHFNIYDQQGNLLSQKTYANTYGQYNLEVLPLENDRFAIFYSKNTADGTGRESIKFVIYDSNGNEIVSEKNPITYARCYGGKAVNLDNGNFLIGYSDDTGEYACRNDRYISNKLVIVDREGKVVQKSSIANIGFFDNQFRFKNGDVGLGFVDFQTSGTSLIKTYKVFIFNSAGGYKSTKDFYSFSSQIDNYDYRFFKIVPAKNSGNYLVHDCVSVPVNSCTVKVYDSELDLMTPKVTLPFPVIASNYCSLYSMNDGKILLDYYKLNSNASAFIAKAFDFALEPTKIPLTIDAGAPKKLFSGKTVSFSDASTSLPLATNISYTWVCKDSAGNVVDGLLSSNAILKPIFTAPKVIAQTKYYCTLNAKEILK